MKNKNCSFVYYIDTKKKSIANKYYCRRLCTLWITVFHVTQHLSYSVWDILLPTVTASIYLTFITYTILRDQTSALKIFLLTFLDIFNIK